MRRAAQNGVDPRRRNSSGVARTESAERHSAGNASGQRENREYLGNAQFPGREEGSNAAGMTVAPVAMAQSALLRDLISSGTSAWPIYAARPRTAIGSIMRRISRHCSL